MSTVILISNIYINISELATIHLLKYPTASYYGNTNYYSNPKNELATIHLLKYGNDADDDDD